MNTSHRSSLVIRRIARPAGVVLLVILAMLAVLALVGIAFTTFSAQEEKTSENYRMSQQTLRVDANPERLFLEALSQLIADSDNPHSAIRGHGLLRRMYGNNNDSNGNGVIDMSEYYLNAYDGPGDLGDTSTTPATPIDFNFIYNYRPPETVWGPLPSPPYPPLSMGWVRGGGFDVDYTYPDHQNMYLAAVRADGTVLVPSFHRPGYISPVSANVGGAAWNNIDDWQDTHDTGAAFSPPNVAGRGRRVILRPRLREHPSFGPGNLPTALPGGLDVDNMGLGRTDSVWVDLGYPVLQTLGGRRFKPLFAFLVVDLDGKLNLNAHGNVLADKITEGTGAYMFPAASADNPSVPDSHADIAPMAILPTSPPAPYAPYADLPLGSGWTPTEINLQNIFSLHFFPTFYPTRGTAPTATQYDPREYSWVLQGRPAGIGVNPFNLTVAGRWGESELLPGIAPRAGATYVAGGFANNVADDDRLYTQSMTPGRFDEGTAATSGGRFGTPPDFDGTGGLAVDGYGNPMYWPRPDQAGPLRFGWGGTTGWTGLVPGAVGPFQALPENIDESAEINLATRKSTDASFNSQDLEALYRFEDVDSSNLPSRLRMLAPSLFDQLLDPMNARRRRNMLTTDSWDLIGFNRVPLLPSSSTSTVPPATPKASYGNGTFPFANFPPFRAALPESIRTGRRLKLTPQLTTPFEKQEFARNLYLIMYANLPQPVSDVQAKRVAQWAINVVDFCDAANGPTNTLEVMSSFVYDKFPGSDINGDGNGWDVTNINPADPSNIGNAELNVVWGAEKPQIYITETLAYEDPVGAFNLWIELFNPTANDIDLAGVKYTYQLVVDFPAPPAANDPWAEGPSSTSIQLRFDMPAPGSTTTIPAGGVLVVGPAGTIPATLGNGPAPTAARYIPSIPFGSGQNGPFRLYLRRLANPSLDADPMPPAVDTFPNSVNPYITVDALDSLCYSNAQFTTNPDTVVSHERESFSVKYQAHPPGVLSAGPTHSIGSFPNATSAPGPWPMIPFNDRPLASPMELLLVPAVGPQQITTAFYRPMPATLNLYTPSGGDVDTSYIQTGVARTGPCRETDDFIVGHLLNFFHETPGAAVPLPGYYRFFEYVEVPSRMNGTWDANIAIPAATPGNDANGRQRLDRVPGKININTIWEQEIFQALLNNHPASLDASAITPSPGPTTDPAWVVGTATQPPVGGGTVPTFAPNGTTYGNASGEPPTAQVTAELWRRVLMSIANPNALDGSAPGTLFTPDDQPFRSFAIGTAGPPGPGPLVSPSIHSTLLRGFSTVIGTPPSVPVFADTRPIAPPGLGRPGAGIPINLDDYPYFKYQLLQKLSNSVTTRSNVFGVWVTVGFFEVGSEDPNRLSGYGIANAPPELGAEVNADVGQNVRHRAFFIIDRSRARGYIGAPRNSTELQDILNQVIVHSRIIE